MVTPPPAMTPRAAQSRGSCSSCLSWFWAVVRQGGAGYILQQYFPHPWDWTTRRTRSELSDDRHGQPFAECRVPQGSRPRRVTGADALASPARLRACTLQPWTLVRAPHPGCPNHTGSSASGSLFGRGRIVPVRIPSSVEPSTGSKRALPGVPPRFLGTNQSSYTRVSSTNRRRWLSYHRGRKES